MKEVDYALEKLRDAQARLCEGIELAQDELDKDGVIQRFEFTFELLWKAAKVFLAHEGIEAQTPRESVKEAFRIGLIEDEELFLDMLEDRNRTPHIYSKKISEQIFERIKLRYVHGIGEFMGRLADRV